MSSPEGITSVGVAAEAVARDGALKMRNHEFLEAQRFFQRALALSEGEHGVGHPATLALVLDVCAALAAQNKRSDALGFSRLELNRAQVVIGSDHVNLAPLLHMMAELELSQGAYARAVTLLEREAAVRSVAASTPTHRRGRATAAHVRALYKLACAKRLAGASHSDCRHAALAAMRLAETTLEAPHPELVSCAYHSGELLVRLGFVDEGLSILRRGLRALQLLPDGHPKASQIVEATQRALRQQAKLGGTRAISTSHKPQPHSQLSEGKIDSDDEDDFSSGETRPLPPGWRRCVSGEASRVYYVNDNTKETTWLHPAGADVSQGDLPPGWEQAIDSDGSVYYIDHNTRRTQLDHPQRRTHRGRTRNSDTSISSWGSISSLLSSVSSTVTQSLSSLSFSSEDSQSLRGTVDCTPASARDDNQEEGAESFLASRLQALLHTARSDHRNPFSPDDEEFC
eukprot:m.136735 g.136735  ORF g.136735 m.136735 type:complete len:457 (-) comp9905_c0_seq6:1152-2522(-)